PRRTAASDASPLIEACVSSASALPVPAKATRRASDVVLDILNSERTQFAGDIAPQRRLKLQERMHATPHALRHDAAVADDGPPDVVQAISRTGDLLNTLTISGV